MRSKELPEELRLQHSHMNDVWVNQDWFHSWVEGGGWRVRF